MKTIDEFLKEHIKPVNFDSLLDVGKVDLFEANDPLATPAADPLPPPADPTAGGDPMMGGDPTAGGADPLAGGAPGADPLAGGEQDAGFGNAETEDDSDEEEDKFDIKGHEDDEDAVKGVDDPDNVTLEEKPAAESIYDFKSLLKSIAAVRAAKAPEELKSMDQVEKALTLIANAKKLKIEDVTFEDPDDAMDLINEIEKPLDIKLRNYIDMKIKQPIIVYRDQNKAEIAAKAAENDKVRDTIDAMNDNTDEKDEEK